MAGNAVWYDKGIVSWVYGPGNPPGTGLQLRLGQSPGQYPIVKDYPAASGQAAVSTVLPVGATGQWYAKIVEKIGTADAVASVEVPFVVSVVVPATLSLKVE